MNRIIIALAVVADIALVVNIHRHWDDGRAIQVEVLCHSTGKIVNCISHSPPIRKET